MKRSLIIIALALLVSLVGLVWLVSRPDELVQPVVNNASNASQAPSFEVHVVMPRTGLPLGGILPDWFVKKLDATPRELRFDHTSRGAKIGSVGPDRLELSADGWDLLIETDSQGRVTAGTRLVFAVGLGGNQMRLNCRPADPGIGGLQTITRAGSDDLAGSFVVELANCKNDESGSAIEWPPAPLTVRGNFTGPPHGLSQEPK